MLHGALFERPGHCQVRPTEDIRAWLGQSRAESYPIVSCSSPSWVTFDSMQDSSSGVREVNHTPFLKRQ